MTLLKRNFIPEAGTDSQTVVVASFRVTVEKESVCPVVVQWINRRLRGKAIVGFPVVCMKGICKNDDVAEHSLLRRNHVSSCGQFGDLIDIRIDALAPPAVSQGGVVAVNIAEIGPCIVQLEALKGGTDQRTRILRRQSIPGIGEFRHRTDSFRPADVFSIDGRIVVVVRVRILHEIKSLLFQIVEARDRLRFLPRRIQGGKQE